MARWHYQGDISLEHGGTFMRFTEWKHGYAEVVEVTDLDSATGFPGAVLIEERTVIIDRPEYWSQALGVIGATLIEGDAIEDNGKATYRKGSLAWRMCLTYALSAYGYYDGERNECVQPERDCPIRHDGWKAKRIRSLKRFVRREFLGYAR